MNLDFGYINYSIFRLFDPSRSKSWFYQVSSSGKGSDIPTVQNDFTIKSFEDIL